MSPTNSDSVEGNTQSTETNDVDSKIPSWLNEDYFVDILKNNIFGFKKIQKFEVKPTGGDGENFASIMLRIKITAELLANGATKEVAFMLKTFPQTEQSQMIVKMMRLFPKELALYGKYIPEFEKMYLEVGKKITFGPKSYRFKKNPGVDYVLLEDIGPMDFKNANRLDGLDMAHSKSVLRLLAAFHAASAVRRETKGDYDDVLMKPIFEEEHRVMLNTVGNPIRKIVIDALNTYEIGRRYADKIKTIINRSPDELIEHGKVDPNSFNVVLHGDLWVNNIMFRYNAEGKREDTIFVDFQVSRVGTPAVDLFYFLLTSTQLKIKLSEFDYLVKYYHENLVHHLKLLHYPKKIPTLKDIHLDLLRKSYFACSTIIDLMGLVLMDPNKDANMDNLIQDGESGRNFKMMMYTNPRYVRHMEAILPWLDLRGLLD